MDSNTFTIVSTLVLAASALGILFSAHDAKVRGQYEDRLAKAEFECERLRCVVRAAIEYADFSPQTVDDLCAEAGIDPGSVRQ